MSRWQRALVTGASRGIGHAFALELARHGTDLVVVARDTEALQALADELHGRHGVDVEVLPADLTDRDALARVEARLRDLQRPVDLLVNNAGTGSAGPFTDQDVEALTELLHVHVRATVRLTHAVLGPLVAAGRGGVINVASVTAFQPVPYTATYAAAKAFLRSFTQAVHEEVRGEGVRVLALCPGFTRTAIVADAGADESAIPGPLWSTPQEVVEAALNGLRRRRAVVVPGVANAAAAAASTRGPRVLARRVSGAIGRYVTRSGRRLP